MGKLRGHRQAPSSPGLLATGGVSGCAFVVGKRDRKLGTPCLASLMLRRWHRGQ